MVMMNIKLVQRGVNSKLNGIGPVPLTQTPDSHAVLAESVEDGAHGIESEVVFGEEVGLDLLQFVAVEVDESAALLAFAVEADFCFGVLLRADVFKTGRAASVDDVFVDDAFVDEALELPVDGGLADGDAVKLEILVDVGGGEVHAGDGFEILEQDGTLLCFIF